MSPEKGTLGEFGQAGVAALPVLLAIVGGWVRTLKQEQCSWASRFAAMATAAFTGVVVHLFMQSVDFHPGLESAVIALSGYAGGDLLRILSKSVCTAAEKIKD